MATPTLRIVPCGRREHMQRGQFSRLLQEQLGMRAQPQNAVLHDISLFHSSVHLVSLSLPLLLWCAFVFHLFHLFLYPAVRVSPLLLFCVALLVLLCFKRAFFFYSCFLPLLFAPVSALFPLLLLLSCPLIVSSSSSLLHFSGFFVSSSLCLLPSERKKQQWTLTPTTASGGASPFRSSGRISFIILL